MNLPVSSRKTDAVSADFLAGEAPDAIVKIAQWDISRTETSNGPIVHEWGLQLAR